MIKQKLNDFIPLVEDKLNSELSPHDNGFTSHYKAMQYSVLAGGKRLRPFIMSLFYTKHEEALAEANKEIEGKKF